MTSQREIIANAPDGTDRIVYRLAGDDTESVVIIDRQIILFGGEDVVIWKRLGRFTPDVLLHMERNAWRARHLQTWDGDRCRFITGPRVWQKYEPPSKPHPVSAPQGHGLPARNWDMWRDVIVKGMSRKQAAQKHKVQYQRACQLVNQHSRYVGWQLNHRDSLLGDYNRLMAEALYGVEIIEQLGCAPYMRMPDGREVQL
jgi:hypothetical protein